MFLWGFGMLDVLVFALVITVALLLFVGGMVVGGILTILLLDKAESSTGEVPPICIDP